MKSKVEQLLIDVQEKIDYYQKQASSFNHGSAEFVHYDRQYAKAVAQYNILLEVLK